MGIYLKGATAHEIQIWRFGVRWVYLSGGLYTWWAPWRRLTFQWFGKDQL